MLGIFNKISSRNQTLLLGALGVLILYILIFHNLTRFPIPWFDEGSHLHVPKTLVNFGVYADISSEGFRYYGPTIGVGPTVMLPIAAVFKLFGVGLLQARLVMALYLIGAILVLYRLVENLGGKWVAWVALALILSSRSVLFLEYGRQLLGEVPGFFFLALALYLWFSRWEGNSLGRLAWIGLLFGLAAITKYQYLLFLAPALILGWLLDIFYYKCSMHRNFLVPGIVAAVSFGIWQLFTLQYLGPATAVENFALLRASAESAAFNFNFGQLAANLGELTSRSAYLGALIPGLLYGFFLSLPRSREGQKWGIVFLLAVLNLVWFVATSIGWLRYAFLGFAFSGIFIARLFSALTDGFKLDWNMGSFRSLFDWKNTSRLAMLAWLLMIILLPMAKTLKDIVLPPPPYARQMAAFLDANIPDGAVIETWDPEMGFLSNRTFHYPPNALLAVAIEQVNYGGAPAQDRYDFIRTDQPPYVLLGVFSKWTNIYPVQELGGHYELVQTFGNYDLYRRTK